MPLFSIAMLLVFALTLFVSATLLFLVQPMIGKMILPLLGGTPAVWNTCMVFFQATLLAGYAYSHAITTWLGVRKQAAIHLLVILLPFVFLPLTINSQLILANTENPVPGLLLLLTLSVGIPFFVVSTTAPLLQKWFSSTDHPFAGDPYFLYGASNFGSMLALIGYPALVEPNYVLELQRKYWTAGFGLLAGMIALSAVFLWLARPAAKPQAAQVDAIPEKIGWARRLRWVALAAIPSSLMLGATTYMTTDIAAIPLLWVLPLTLYLLTFIFVFAKLSVFAENLLVFVGAVGCLLALAALAGMNLLTAKLTSEIWVNFLVAIAALGGIFGSIFVFSNRREGLIHRAVVFALPLAILAVLFMTFSDIRPARVQYTIAIHLVTLFVVAMVCHGELARDRPTPRHLTEFFLWMSVGGVVGGLFNGLIAPLIFTSIVEYQLAMLAACFVLPATVRTEPEEERTYLSDVMLAAAMTAVALVLIALRLPDQHLPQYSLNLAAFSHLRNLAWPIALVLAWMAAVGLYVHRPGFTRSGFLDLMLPAALALFTLGLYVGLDARVLAPAINQLAGLSPFDTPTFTTALAYGLPTAICYTFVQRSLRFGLSVGGLMLAASVCTLFSDTTLCRERSFFGVMTVERGASETGDDQQLRFNRLVHGTTWHGWQFLDPELRDEPTSYFHYTGGIGQVMTRYNAPDIAIGAVAGSFPGLHAWPGSRKNIAVIGLGTGTLAAYARPGQHLTFYEIDRLVRKLAYDSEEYFSFVADAGKRGAKVDFVLGDARLTLNEFKPTEDEQYGILVVDAFSSDAIPIHLLTKEALEIYLAKLRPDGILCFNISNRYLNLRPVLANLTLALGLSGAYLNDRIEDNGLGKTQSVWVAIAREPRHIARLFAPARGVSSWVPLVPPKDYYVWPDEDVGIWTDDFSNLWKVFNRDDVPKKKDRDPDSKADSD